MGFDVKRVTKLFHDRTGAPLVALQNVALSVSEGEFVSLVGPSGCGKSTLLRVIAGLLAPSSGEVVFKSPPAKGQLRTAMVFQEQALFPWMNVETNILFRQGPVSDLERRDALNMMDKIGLSEFRHHFPHQLSGGLRQRAALAKAFLAAPQVILMDEPFGSLDAQTRLVLQEELLKIWNDNQVTVVFVTHDIEEAILLSDRVIVMSYRPGRILEDISIPFSRPRDFELQKRPEYHRLKSRIWNHLESEVRKSIGAARSA